MHHQEQACIFNSSNGVGAGNNSRSYIIFDTPIHTREMQKYEMSKQNIIWHKGAK